MRSHGRFRVDGVGRLRRLGVVLTLALACAAGASCGGGGGGGGEDVAPAPQAPTALGVVDEPRPVLQLGAPVTLRLSAEGGLPPYRWNLVADEGSPPPGVNFDSTGAFVGSPGAEGDFSFRVRVEDAAVPAHAATAVVTLTVGGFDLDVVGLTCGEPWAGSSYFVVSTGGGGTVTFALVVNGSGGRILDEDPAAHTARYEAGPDPGTDVVRARRPDGRFTDLALSVVENPAPYMVARFGSTDVWWVRFD